MKPCTALDNRIDPSVSAWPKKSKQQAEKLNGIKMLKFLCVALIGTIASGVPGKFPMNGPVTSKRP